MLKQYLEREEDDQKWQPNDESQVCADSLNLVEFTADEVIDECSDGLIEIPSLCE